jgi:pSer/pThr/pTyr-binding forkhead associated (FHA) protein
MQSCPRCGEANTESASFCQFCGSPIARRAPPPAARSARTCTRCRTTNPPGTNFCHNCGSRLDEAALAAVPPPVTGELHVATGPARLVAVRRDGTDGPSYDVVGDQFDVGRSEGDLLFDDPHIASRHARIARRDGQYLISPLEVRNGVYVRIRQPTDLSDGDYVLLGKQVLKFELPIEAEKTLRPAVEHGVVLFGTPVKPPWGRLRQLTSAGTTRDLFHLTRSEVILGREQGDVVFSDDEFLSRRHAQLQCRGGRVTLTDLGSSNGTFVRLRGPHTLSPGEMLRMGDELLRFEIG